MFYERMRLAAGCGLILLVLLGSGLHVRSRSASDQRIDLARGGTIKPSGLEQSRPRRLTATAPRQTSTFSLLVLTAEDSSPVPETRLLIDYWNGNQSSQMPVLQSDRQGIVEFTVPAPPFDLMRLWVSADGRVPKLIDWHQYELSAPLTSYTVKLERGTRLSGLVRNEAGDPVSGATISFMGPGINMAERENAHFHSELSAVTSDEQGHWSMDQMPANKALTIRASHPDYAITALGTWALAGGNTNVLLVLTNGFPVYGQVISTDGKPVAAASVCKESGASRCTETDLDGRFSWPRTEPGKVWINIRAPGFEELNQAIQVGQGSNNVVFKLAPIPGADQFLAQGTDQARKTIRVAGTVVDADNGRPVPLFRVLQGSALHYGVETPISNGRFLGEGHNGRFDWELNTSGSDLVLQVQADGYQPAVAAPQPNLVFKLHRSSTVSGTVQMPDGSAAVGATVSLSGMGYGCTMQKEGELLAPNTGFASTRTQTDQQGHFRLESMTGAQGLVAVHRSGYAFLPFTITSNAVLNLEPWGAIDGVLYVGGQPAPGQPVWVDGVQHLAVPSRFALSFSYHTQTDQEGHFRFDRVPAGDHFVARMANYIPNEPGVLLESHGTVAHVRPGQTAAIELRGHGRAVIARIQASVPAADLSRGMSQAFLMVDGSAAPESSDFANPGAQYRALQRFHAQNRFPFAFQSDGSIRAEDVPPGKYSLEIRLAAATPDPVNMEKSLGTLKKTVTIPPGESPLDLGRLAVK